MREIRSRGILSPLAAREARCERVHWRLNVRAPGQVVIRLVRNYRKKAMFLSSLRDLRFVGDTVPSHEWLGYFRWFRRNQAGKRRKKRAGGSARVGRDRRTRMSVELAGWEWWNAAGYESVAAAEDGRAP